MLIQKRQLRHFVYKFPYDTEYKNIQYTDSVLKTCIKAGAIICGWLKL